MKNWHQPLSRRDFIKFSAAAGAGAALVAEYSLSASPALAAMEQLIEAAKTEGALSTIALPRDWANYGEMIDAFQKKYPFLKYTGLSPDASSAEELEAIKANKNNKGSQAPDVIDVGFAFGPQAKEQGLTQPYKVATWDTIPEAIKDSEGHWWGGYYGVMSFEINKSVVKEIPQDWSDLLKPIYKNQVALAGDPRGSGVGLSAVVAAAMGNGGSLDDVMPGLEFYKKLNEAGNLLPVSGDTGNFAKGETPIVLTWDYLALGNRDTLKGNPDVAVVIPQTGVYAGAYVQGISAYSPRPNAAKLWQEFLFSDEGQLIWLKGYSRPARFNDLNKRKLIPEELLAKLPPAESYAKAAFPTVAQADKAKKTVADNWDKIVKVEVK